MEQQSSIGSRVRETIDRVLPVGTTDASVAAEIGMKPDQFSRSVSGGRNFSSLEIARLADFLKEDVHWLITGDHDPYRVVFAARHDWDPETMTRHVPGREDDESALKAIRLAYTQALIWLNASGSNDPADPANESDSWTGQPHLPALPDSPQELRALLGVEFVGNFADRLEEVLGIEVVRIPGLSTDYSFTLGGRRVIVLTAQSNWFRSNFSLAHEVGHLALGHHDAVERNRSDETAANQFANELLLPEADMRAINWQEVDEEQLARKIWEWGVSTQALGYRLNTLRLPQSLEVRAGLADTTQGLLRRHPSVTTTPVSIQPGMSITGVLFATADPISVRMKYAAERRIPSRLLSHHLDGIAAGRINKSTLAWLLNTPVDELEVAEPAQAPEMSADELMAELGFATQE